MREGYFLASLKNLQLSWGYYPSSEDVIYFEALASLLRQCMDTLEDLTFEMLFDIDKGSFWDEFSNNGVF